MHYSMAKGPAGNATKGICRRGLESESTMRCERTIEPTGFTPLLPENERRKKIGLWAKVVIMTMQFMEYGVHKYKWVLWWPEVVDIVP